LCHLTWLQSPEFAVGVARQIHRVGICPSCRFGQPSKGHEIVGSLVRRLDRWQGDLLGEQADDEAGHNKAGG